MSISSWTRLIRFTTSDSSEVYYGEPVADDFSDVGGLADQGLLSARIILVGSEGPLSPSSRVTDQIVKVDRLLGPLDQSWCTDIKCIGLNYKKHSMSPCRNRSLIRSSRGRQDSTSSTPVVPQASDGFGRL